MNFDPRQYQAIFCDEAAEHVVLLEAALLRLEADPADGEAVGEAFRAAHTVKGGADAIGFPGLAKFTHGLEELLGRLRGGVAVTRQALDLLLEGCDCLGRYVSACRSDGPPPAGVDELLARLRKGTDGDRLPDPPSHEPSAAAKRNRYTVTIDPHTDAFLCGLDPLRLIREVAALGTVGHVDVEVSRLPLDCMEPEWCYLAWTLTLDTDQPPSVIEEVFEFAREKVRVTVVPTEQEAPVTIQPGVPEPLAGKHSHNGSESQSGSPLHVPKSLAAGLSVNSPTGVSVPEPIAMAVSLVERGTLTAEQALDALNRQRLARPMLGAIAVQLGHLSDVRLKEILAGMDGGQPFGVVAMHMGYLTEDVLAKLFMYQEWNTPPLTDVLAMAGLMSNTVAPPPPDLSVLDDYGPMIGEFCQEADEHLETADRHLLTIDADPTNAEALNAVYRGFHTIKGVSSMLGLAIVQTLAHEAESLLNLAREGTVTLKGKPLDLVFLSTDALKWQIRRIRKWAEDRAPMDEDPGLGILLADLRATVAGQTVSQQHPGPAPSVTPPPARAHAPVVPSESSPASPPPPPKAEPVAAKAEPPARRDGGNTSKETVRVDKDRLDKLINIIGELVIAQSMAQQEFDELNDGTGAMSLALPELSKISRDLQELSLSLRMVPLQGTFQKMARLVRDLSRKMDKPVEFELHGEETELDKTVVDQLGDPLMHMVRNAVDHGLEDPAERVAAGKPAEGRVVLKAYHQGGSVYVELSDDGKGMDRERLVRKAVEKGIVQEGQRLSDAEAYALIFAPGFSTAKAVTDVSGRGVGMDVVRRNVEALQGNILINTKLGSGTTFTIRLPLTLAIMDGLMVSLGEDVYVLPLLSVIESFRPRPADLHTIAARGEAVTVRGEVVPLLRLHQLLGRPARMTDPCQALVVLMEAQGKKHALLVDELLGQMQAVVKSLDSNYKRVDGLAGATILGDGRVAMIIDIHGLTQLHTQSGGGVMVPAAPDDLFGDLA
jgi:two-component system chemotaxis sensor kinase CheA